MAVANSGSASAAASPLLRPTAPGPIREAHRLSLGRSALRRPILRGDACLPFLSCRCSNTASTCGGGDDDQSCSSRWDWNFWTRHFSDMDQAEKLSSTLKSQLQEAVEHEDFPEAAKLKTFIAEVTSNDPVAKVLLELKNAIEGEKYDDASRLTKLSNNELIGWWAGWGEGADDPFGRIIRITPAFGRYVATSYSLREVLDGSLGSPEFEIFLAREDDGTYKAQVVALQRVKENSTHPSSSALSSTGKSSVERRDFSDDISLYTSSNSAADKQNIGAAKINSKNVNNIRYNEEFLKNVISILKEKIPGLSVKGMNVTVPEEINMDMGSPSKGTEDKNRKTQTVQYIPSTCQESSSDTCKNMPKQLFVSDIIQDRKDAQLKYIRVPAEIKDFGKDSFTLHLPGKSFESGGSGTTKPLKFRVEVVTGRSTSGSITSDTAKAMLNENIATLKVSKEVLEVIKFSIAQAQSGNTLPQGTTFKRLIGNDKNALDPFNGLYVGSFSPYGTEVVQLQRKYGNWNDSDESEPDEPDSETEFFEYVEATKLTGDLIVPAGQVTFRAKIGKEYAASPGMFPKGLDVVSFYKGQGRTAEPGYKEPKWVAGELLKLSGKSFDPRIKGRELGLLYPVSGRCFMVMLERLELPQ